MRGCEPVLGVVLVRVRRRAAQDGAGGMEQRLALDVEAALDKGRAPVRSMARPPERVTVQGTVEEHARRTGLLRFGREPARLCKHTEQVVEMSPEEVVRGVAGMLPQRERIEVVEVPLRRAPGRHLRFERWPGRKAIDDLAERGRVDERGVEGAAAAGP